MKAQAKVLFFFSHETSRFSRSLATPFCGAPSDEQVLHEQCREH